MAESQTSAKREIASPKRFGNLGFGHCLPAGKAGNLFGNWDWARPRLASLARRSGPSRGEAGGFGYSRRAGFTPSLKTGRAPHVPADTYPSSGNSEAFQVGANSMAARERRAIFSAGFSLIEMLVVMAVIAALASILLAAMSDVRRKGRDLQRVSDIKEIQKALELYYDSSRQYPPDLATLTDPSSCGPSYCIVSVPRDPVGGTAYPYSVCGDSYHLGAGLENRGHIVLGTDRDLTPMCAGDSINGQLENGASSAACEAGAGRSCFDVSALQ